MKREHSFGRHIAVAALVCALAIPCPALGQADNEAKKPGRKAAITVLVTGLALVGVGAVGMGRSSNDCHGQWVSDGSGLGIPCTPIPWLQRDGTKMGIVAIGVGSAVTVGGLVMLSKSGRTKTASTNWSAKAELARSRAISPWLYAQPGTPGSDSQCAGALSNRESVDNSSPAGDKVAPALLQPRRHPAPGCSRNRSCFADAQ